MSFDFRRARRRVARALATTALLATCAAQAGTIEPELGLGYASGHEFAGSAETLILQGALGYYMDNGIGARLLAIGFADFVMLDFGNVPRSLENFVGVQVVDHFALSDHWSAMLGAGLGRSRYNLYDDVTKPSNETEGIVTVGIRWKPATHYAMSLQYSYLTQSSVSSTALMFHVPF